MATATTAARTADPEAAPGTTRTEKGISLARGPALILGTILLAAGLYFLYKAHSFPPFSNLPNGKAPKDGNFFFGIFGANGWTGMLTAVGGGLLLFGAAQHLLAKTMSLIVGVALGAAAVIALISGNVLGMAAANGWTELGWAACAVILLFNTLIPRRRRTVAVADDTAAAGGMGARHRTHERDRMADREMAGRDGGERGMATERNTTMVDRDRGMATDRGITTDGDSTMADRDSATMSNENAATSRGNGATRGGEPLVTRTDDGGSTGAETPTTTKRRGGLFRRS